VRGGRIEHVGTAAEVAAAAPDLTVTDLGGDLLLPGLVDAHTHLEWSLLEGLLPPGDFASWLGRLLPLRARMTPSDHLAAARYGALQALRHGTTTLADLGPVGAGATALAESGQRGLVLLEAFGRDEGRAATEAAALVSARLAEIDDVCGPRVRAGVSPHAPYTVGPALWHALAARADLRERPWGTHLAESPHELPAIRDGGGALGAVFAAAGFTPGRWPAADGDEEAEGVVPRLDVAGALLPGMVAAHCVEVDAGDAAVLAARGVAVAHCPRSNAHLRCGRAPVEDLRAAGVAVALGTDSAASGGDHDLRAEARACRVAHAGVHDVGDDDLLRMITADAAAVLGMAGEVGVLVPGARADLIALAPAAHDEARDPVALALDPATTVHRVVVGGEVLVSGGAPTRLDHEGILARAREARARLC
jgi:5-methylthioadenosine/S-adenosylhomocysteine deaminase